MCFVHTSDVGMQGTFALYDLCSYEKRRKIKDVGSGVGVSRRLTALTK
jgi:hypothetical protein